jgi:hypothetical protein
MPEFRKIIMGDYRDIHNGVNDPVGGTDVKRNFKDNKAPHERAQTAADVRAEASPDENEEFLPEALRRPPTSALNKRTGRNVTK